MKMLILTNNDVGLYQFRRELIERLLEYGQICISLPYGELVEPLIEYGCRFIDTPINRRGLNPIADIRLLRIYQKIIKSEKPDLVITYTIKPNVYGGVICRIADVPYAINITGLGTAFKNGGVLKKVAIIMNKIACKKAKVVFFENEDNRQIFIKEHIVKANQTYRLDGAGVNLEKYQVASYPNGNKIKFLFMGRVMAEKGVDELFDAMQKLVADGLDCHLDILGGYEENYKDIIDKYEAEGWLSYHGFQKDVRPYIERCHCFVLPSWHEGMANTNLECAASGRPVITSNIPGCKEAIEDNISGYLVECRNSSDLYLVMKRFTCLSFDNRKRMGLQGRKRMELIFDKKKVVEETVSKLLME